MTTEPSGGEVFGEKQPAPGLAPLRITPSARGTR